jgi:hypothetical protein
VITVPGGATRPGLGLPVGRYVIVRPPAMVTSPCRPPGDPPGRAGRWW